jgi:hypothetical protein
MMMIAAKREVENDEGWWQARNKFFSRRFLLYLQFLLLWLASLSGEMAHTHPCRWEKNENEFFMAVLAGFFGFASVDLKIIWRGRQSRGAEREKLKISGAAANEKFSII